MSEKTYYAVVHLRDGGEIETQIAQDRSFSANDFTGDVLWRFISRDLKKNFFIPGDRIKYIELQGI